MKRLLNIKVGICVVVLLLICVTSVGIFHVLLQQKLDLTTTYIAAHNIAPRTQITESDLIEVEVSNAYLLDYTYIDKEDIIGKYTDIQGMIPAGSAFYQNMLYNASDLPDQPSILLKEGQTAYTLNTDVSKLGSLIAGNRVDVYVSITNDKQTITGCLFENARIIDIKDHKGLRLNDPESTGMPSYVEIAINRDDIKYLSLAETQGEIRLFMSDNQSDVDLEATLQVEGEVYLALTKKSDAK